MLCQGYAYALVSLLKALFSLQGETVEFFMLLTVTFAQIKIFKLL